MQERHEENKENIVDISEVPNITKEDNAETVVLSASSGAVDFLSQTETREKTVPQNIIVQNVAQCAPRDKSNFVAPVLTDTGAVSMKDTCFTK